MALLTKAERSARNQRLRRGMAYLSMLVFGFGLVVGIVVGTVVH